MSASGGLAADLTPPHPTSKSETVFYLFSSCTVLPALCMFIYATAMYCRLQTAPAVYFHVRYHDVQSCTLSLSHQASHVQGLSVCYVPSRTSCYVVIC